MIGQVEVGVEESSVRIESAEDATAPEQRLRRRRQRVVDEHSDDGHGGGGRAEYRHGSADRDPESSQCRGRNHDLVVRCGSVAREQIEVPGERGIPRCAFDSGEGGDAGGGLNSGTRREYLNDRGACGEHRRRLHPDRTTRRLATIGLEVKRNDRTLSEMWRRWADHPQHCFRSAEQGGGGFCICRLPALTNRYCRGQPGNGDSNQSRYQRTSAEGTDAGAPGEHERDSLGCPAATPDIRHAPGTLESSRSTPAGAL